MNEIPYFRSRSKLDLKLYLDVFLCLDQNDTGQIMALNALGVLSLSWCVSEPFLQLPILILARTETE